MANTEKMSVTLSKVFLHVVESVMRTFKADSTYGDKLEPGVIVAKNDIGPVTKGEAGKEALITLASYPAAADAVVGTYVIKCTQAHADAAGNVPEKAETWSVTNPNGTVLGTIELKTGATSKVWDNEIRFTLANASLNAAVDNAANLVVATGSGKLVVWNPASNKPYGIVMEEANGKTADVGINVLLAGVVDQSKLISLVGSESAPVEAAVEELRMRNIICKEVI